VSIEGLSFQDPKTGHFVKSKLKGARMIEGVLELTFGMAYDIDGEVLPVVAALGQKAAKSVD